MGGPRRNVLEEEFVPNRAIANFAKDTLPSLRQATLEARTKEPTNKFPAVEPRSHPVAVIVLVALL